MVDSEVKEEKIMIGKCCITQTYRREPWERIFKLTKLDAQARLGQVENTTRIEPGEEECWIQTGPGRESHPE